LVGSDQRDWVTGVTNYAGARFDEVWSGIGVHYYDAGGGTLEHDFLVSPGADVGRIATRIEGAREVRLDGGDLVMRLSTGELRQHAPFAYQVIDGRRVEVASKFVVRGGTVGFEVGGYDHGRELVIDPIWNYRSYFGGTRDQQGTGISIAPDGTAYVVGNTTALWDPGEGTRTTLDNAANAGKSDVFVAAFS